MADPNTTIDQLAITIAANADTATTSVDNFASALGRLNTQLPTALSKMSALAASFKTMQTALRTSVGKEPIAPTIKAQTQIENLQKRFGTLNAAFAGVRQDMTAGLIPVNAGLKQLSGLAGQAATAVTTLKVTAEGADMAMSFEDEDMALSVMRRELDAINANFRKMSPLAKQAQVAVGGVMAGTWKMGSGQFAPTPFTSVAASNLAQTRSMTTAVAAQTAAVAKSHPMWQKFDQITTRVANRNKILGNSFIQLRSKIFFALFALGLITAFFKTFIGAAASYVEKINLFQVAFGDATTAANNYANSITQALGIDPVAFRETYSSFYLIANSLGMASEKAMTLSQNITQLAYDYASIFEMDFEDVTAKFRSAMAGQTRAISYFGLDVTLASLQEEALREGIEGNVREFSKANKIILMHNLIVRNSAVVQGDLARTLASPANMLRVLKDQFAIAARAIGYMFMPMLKALLPWLIVITQAITRAATALLGFFGISMPSFSDLGASIGDATGGTDDLFEGMDDAAGATGRAAKAAKELRDYVMGIDELNIIPQPTDTAGGGGGGAGGGGAGIDIQPFDVYDMIKGAGGLDAIVAPLLAIFDRLKARFQPFIDSVTRLWDAIKPFARDIWDGFKTAWGGFWQDFVVALGDGVVNEDIPVFLDAVSAALEWFNLNPKIGNTLGSVAAALVGFAASVQTFSIRMAMTPNIFVWIIKNIPGAKEELAEFGDNVAYWFDYYKQEMADLITKALEKYNQLKQFWADLKTAAAKDWFEIVTTFTNAKIEIVRTIDALKTSMSNIWNGLSSGLDGVVATVRSLFRTMAHYIIKSVNEGPLKAINALITAAKSLPGISALMGGVSTIPHIPVPALAAGGMPPVGSIFQAGEAGAELLGSYGGNNSTVMPLKDSGFVEAMAAAVYSATVAALNSSAQGGGGGDVYIDGVKAGKVIKKSTDRAAITSGLIAVGTVG